MNDEQKDVTPEPAKKPRTMGGLTALLVLGALILLGLFIWADKERRKTAESLKETQSQLEELRSSTETSPQDLANEVRTKVAALIDIPADPAPTVATINDVDRLRESNPFFNAAENGDFLLLTESRAILYDMDRNIIIDVAPFRITQESSPLPSGGSRNQQASPSRAPSPASSPVSE